MPLRVTHLSVQETLAESEQATESWQVTQHASRDSWKGWGRGRGLEVEACPFVAPALLRTCLWSLRKREECRPPPAAPLTLLTAWCPRLSRWRQRGCQAPAPTGLPLPNHRSPWRLQPASFGPPETPMKWWQERWT